jgi:asparagine synthase (glutamine-hydrolysing)
MCGIAGIVDLEHPVEKACLERMIQQLRHRGPDGTGFYQRQNIGLAHARLSIIDLTTGEQPIHNESKDVWVVFNGEIFNYIELRKELEKQGHQFYTRTDTEVIVHLYEQYGSGFVSHLNGQFAIAIWDERMQKLTLARDRVGIAPLFYRFDGRQLLFGSEIKAINACSQQSAEINITALDQILTFWTPVSPETIFRGTYEVSPGQLIEFEKGEITKKKYWEWGFPEDGNYREEGVEILREELLDLLIDATRIRLRSDVPVGAYLSGGLDSSVIASLIHQYGNVPLRTFSIGFKDERLDEGEYQQEMIRHLQAEHSHVYCDQADISRTIEEVIWHTETPILRSAPVPMGMLSSLVHQENYKVVLTGEGSDEVLGGYDIFKEAKIRQFWAKYPQSEVRASLLKRLYPYLDLSRGQAYLNNFFGEGIDKPGGLFFSHLPRWTTTSKIKEFYSEGIREQLVSDAYSMMEESYPPGMNRWDPFNRAQYIEPRNLMPGYLLSSQGDRMLMSHSVEGRFPFLDHRVIEFGNKLPPKYKMKALNEKYLLKQAAREYLPGRIIKRYKQPYRAPDIPSFFIGGVPDDVVTRHLSSDSLNKAGYFDSKKVAMLIKKIQAGRAIGIKDNMAFMAILTTQIWHDHFINR